MSVEKICTTVSATWLFLYHSIICTLVKHEWNKLNDSIHVNSTYLYQFHLPLSNCFQQCTLVKHEWNNLNDSIHVNSTYLNIIYSAKLSYSSTMRSFVHASSLTLQPWDQCSWWTGNVKKILYSINLLLCIQPSTYQHEKPLMLSHSLPPLSQGGSP